MGDNKETKPTGLGLMRVPFPDNQIGKLPKGSKAQMQCKAEEKVTCKICGGWHHPKLIHLDFVGHAALTDRLLDADPLWYWEPLAFTAEGLPAFDDHGGLWIKLTVCGHTRIGYGNAESSQYKEIGSREKEVIGDALRNAAMRFGAALELWHKGDLHIKGDDEDNSIETYLNTLGDYQKEVDKCQNADEVIAWMETNRPKVLETLSERDAKKLKIYCNGIIDIFNRDK